jgi:hypothetical protein
MNWRHEMNKIFVVIPTYFDGKSVVEIVGEINDILESNFSMFSPFFVLVDDSCGKDKSLNDLSIKLPNITNLNLIKSEFNLGNQGAIILGLYSVLRKLKSGDLALVLDGDGEDDPKDIKLLINSIKADSTLDIVLAERGKRASDLKFKFSLIVFKIIFYILTGKKWRAGNFSILRGDWLLEHYDLIHTYNSFAGSIQSLGANRVYRKIDRKPRRYGSSQTSSQGKILHALNSLTPWVETIQIRSLLFFGFMFLNFTISIVVVSILKFGYHLTAPNWVTLVIFSAVSLSLIALNIFLTSQILISIINVTKKIKSNF